MSRTHQKPRRSPPRPRFEDLPDLLTARQTFDYLQLSKNAGYDAIRRGEIPSKRYGRVIRVPKEALK